MISHTQRFFNPPGLLPPLPYTGNPLRALTRSVDDIHFDLNRNTLPDRQLHDNNAKLFYDFKNKNLGNIPYIGRNNAMSRPCYTPYPNMSSLYYKTSPDRKDMNMDRSPSMKPMWGMEHVGEYCAELLNRDKHYWTEEETGLMLELYEENKDYFNDNKTKKTKLWSVIANIINKRFSTNVNSEQCSQKYRNLKAEFLKIADPTSLDGGAKKFGRHFVQMKRLIEAEEKSIKNNSSNNWQVKEESVEGGGDNLNKRNVDMQPQSSNANSPTDVSPTNPENAQINVVLQSTQLQSANLPDDIQATLTLTNPLSLQTQDNLKLDLRTNDLGSNQDMDCKFDSPNVTENQCMIDTTSNLNQINQALRDKNQCLLDSMTTINQTVSGIGHSLRGISPSMETSAAEVLTESPKREVLISMSSHEAELLKLPRSLQTQTQKNEESSEHYLLVKGESSTTPSDESTSDDVIDFQERSSPNITSYSNELNDIFNDYFMSRGKELEIYECKERQNIVCMNKCIDVFRKIMMEKIN